MSKCLAQRQLSYRSSKSRRFGDRATAPGDRLCRFSGRPTLHCGIQVSKACRDQTRTLTTATKTPPASSASGQRTSILDRVTTTLPLDGDADNPLSVLVELSVAASSVYPHVTSSSSLRRPDFARHREGDDYYAPLERTLKEEAPHIMAFINTHEWAAPDC